MVTSRSWRRYNHPTAPRFTNPKPTNATYPNPHFRLSNHHSTCPTPTFRLQTTTIQPTNPPHSTYPTTTIPPTQPPPFSLPNPKTAGGGDIIIAPSRARRHLEGRQAGKVPRVRHGVTQQPIASGIEDVQQSHHIPNHPQPIPIPPQPNPHN